MKTTDLINSLELISKDYGYKYCDKQCGECGEEDTQCGNEGCAIIREAIEKLREEQTK